MTTFDTPISYYQSEQYHDAFDFDLASEINEDDHSIRPAQAKVLSYRKSKGNLVHNNSQSQLNLPPSPAESMMMDLPQQNDTIADEMINGGDRSTTTVHRDSLPAHARKTPEQKDLNKRRSQYYDDRFEVKEPAMTVRERITKESIVLAEIRTNVIISDEYNFITDLSYQLSSRYQRPESCIAISLQHSACLVFAGSFEPAYILTLTVLPTLVQPMTNRRNAALLQKSLQEALHVDPSRGIIKFLQLPEDSYANNGQTYAGEIDDLEHRANQDSKKEGQSRPSSKSGDRTSKKRNSIRSLRHLRSAFGSKESLPSLPSSTSPEYAARSGFSPPPIPVAQSNVDKTAAKIQAMPRRKSFLGLFASKKENS